MDNMAQYRTEQLTVNSSHTIEDMLVDRRQSNSLSGFSSACRLTPPLQVRLCDVTEAMSIAECSSLGPGPVSVLRPLPSGPGVFCCSLTR